MRIFTKIMPYFVLPLFCLSAPAVTIDSMHAACIKFYGFQRAGIMNKDPKNPFYTRGAPYPHQNDNYQGTALDGGWYDAGDFVKFGLPLGYATYCLLKGYDAFPEGYDDRDSPDYTGKPNGIPDILDEVKTATDYMCKAVISSSTIIRDVGDGNSDHQAITEDGYTNSTRTNGRPAYVCDGADVPGYYAAALALMSLLYKKYDSTYAKTVLDKAKTAYTFGKGHAKVCSAQTMNSENRPFYQSATWEDKMACAALELFRASGDSTYLLDARTYLGKVVPHYACLGYMHAGDLAGYTFYRLGEVTAAGVWLQDVQYGQQRVVPSTAGSGAARVKGAFVNQTWGVAGDVAAFGFSNALLYRCNGDNTTRDMAFQELNWAIGNSPYQYSYVTQLAGSNGVAVVNPHHRNDNTLGRQLGKRLIGGLVSGPSTSASPFDPTQSGTYQWSFSDDVNNYQYTEPALNYGAGLAGLIAFKRYYDKSSCNRIDTGITLPSDRVDFTTTSSITIKATLENSLAWTLTITGPNSKATRQWTGTGKQISVTWDGSAQSGMFQSGENVDIALAIANMCDYCNLKAHGSLLIVGTPDFPFPSTAIKIDDFDDSNLVNALQGVWEGFSDKSDGVAGGASAKPSPLTLGVGKTGKGLQYRMTATTGATHPYAGVKTSFRSDKAAVSLSSHVSSIMFDIDPTTSGKVFRVELEQPDITDGAYWGATVTTGTYDHWTRIAVPLSSFAQPSWRTAAKPFNKQNVTALRFVIYDAGNSLGLTIDNVYIDSMTLGPAGVRRPAAGMASGSSFRIAYRKGVLEYIFPYDAFAPQRWTAAVFSAGGRKMFGRPIDPLKTGGRIALPAQTLPAGSYVLVHSCRGVEQPGAAAFVVTHP